MPSRSFALKARFARVPSRSFATCKRTTEVACTRDGFGTVSQSEVSGRFRDGFGCPRPKTRPRKTNDLCDICESIWASDLQQNSRTSEELCRFARVPPRSFFGVNLPIEAPILEGPRGQNPYLVHPDLAEASFGRLGRDAASRSDPTFTRASPG